MITLETHEEKFRLQNSIGFFLEFQSQQRSCRSNAVWFKEITRDNFSRIIFSRICVTDTALHELFPFRSLVRAGIFSLSLVCEVNKLVNA